MWLAEGAGNDGFDFGIKVRTFLADGSWYSTPMSIDPIGAEAGVPPAGERTHDEAALMLAEESVEEIEGGKVIAEAHEVLMRRLRK
jgi:hypothetical protein